MLLRDSNNFFVKWLRSLDKTILILLIIWLSASIIFCSNTTLSFASIKIYNDPGYLLKKYYFFLFFGVFIMITLSFFNDLFFQKSSKFFLLISIILLILTLFVGLEVKGSKRWISLFFFNLQPIELLKPFFIVFLSSFLCSDNKFKFKFFFSSLFVFGVIFILLLQPDYSQSLIILALWLILIFVSGISFFIIFSLVVFAGSSMIAILFLFKDSFSYIFLRFEKWLSATDIGYQSEKALDAIKYGGFWGRGIGEGILKEKIPEAHTDYVLASVSEEFGIFAIIFILLIIISLFMRVFAITQTNISDFRKYTLLGLSSLMLIQIFINVGVTINLIPSTGMTFPFLSYGGSSIITSSITIGIILSLTKNLEK